MIFNGLMKPIEEKSNIGLLFEILVNVDLPSIPIVKRICEFYVHPTAGACEQTPPLNMRSQGASLGNVSPATDASPRRFGVHEIHSIK